MDRIDPGDLERTLVYLEFLEDFLVEYLYHLKVIDLRGYLLISLKFYQTRISFQERLEEVMVVEQGKHLVSFVGVSFFKATTKYTL